MPNLLVRHELDERDVLLVQAGLCKLVDAEALDDVVEEVELDPFLAISIRPSVHSRQADENRERSFQKCGEMVR